MLGIRARKITLWEGTADEREIMFLGDGGGALIEGDIGNCIYIMPEIPFTDNETIDKYELTNVRIYAEFNERLYLCYKFGKNVDPMKDLVFNRPIPIEYKEYIDIIHHRKLRRKKKYMRLTGNRWGRFSYWCGNTLCI